MTIMNNQEKNTIEPLGKALQGARLSASLTVEEVAERLNLAVSTVLDIEDDLDKMIENQEYPSIYLRGYIANYAKLVALDKLDQFSEYRQLSESQNPPRNLRPAVNISPEKKRLKRLLLLVVLIVAFAFCFFIVQQVFFSESKPVLPDSEEIKQSNEKLAADIISSKAKVAASKVGNGAETTDILSADLQTGETVVAQDKAVKNKTASEQVAVKNIVNSPTAEAEQQTALLKSSESAEKTEAITKEQVNAQKVLLDKEVAAENALATASLQLTFSADCWAEIFDAKGKRLAFNLYKKGSLLTVNGVAPFKLKLGDPSAVVIQYQNKIFEHEFEAGRTVRFSIPQS